jgi:TRAP-type C4-dicarboxylate transport system substrate-binding protein
MDGPVGEQLFAQLKEKTGIVGLAWWDNGFRHMTNKIRPVNTVEDMAGINIRVIPNPLFIATWTALGTNPTPLPWPELYSALENGAVDGQETPYALIYTARFYEVQKYLAKTGHVYTPFVLLASQKWFGSLLRRGQGARHGGCKGIGRLSNAIFPARRQSGVGGRARGEGLRDHPADA